MRIRAILGRLRVPAHTTLAAYLALFLALSGGTALALKGKNTVFSDDIKNNQVKGDDVNEQSLGEVPSAANAGHAANANNAANAANTASLGGVGAAEYTIGGARVLTAYAEQAASNNQPASTILALPGIGVIRGACDAIGDTEAVLDFINSSGQPLRYRVSRGSSTPNPIISEELGGNNGDGQGANSQVDDTFLIQLSPVSTTAPVKVATVSVAVHENEPEDTCEYGWQGTSFPKG